MESASASSYLNEESVDIKSTTIICVPLQLQVHLGAIERINMI